MFDGTLSSYQEGALTTVAYPRPQWWDPGLHVLARAPLEGLPDDAVAAMKMVPIFYAACGLGGEAGEVLEQIKKSWRNDMQLTEERRQKLAAELGDVLWYVAVLASELDLPLADIAAQNLSKLNTRKAKGQLKEHS